MSILKVKWPKVMYFNNLLDPPLIEWIDLGNGTMFRLFAFFSHGGHKRPRRGLFVGIEGCGCFLFGLSNKIYSSYASGKLNISNSDAECMSDWLNVQLGHNVKQQGKYYERYILNVEPYRLLGENYLMPLRPEIINEENSKKEIEEIEENKIEEADCVEPTS